MDILIPRLITLPFLGAKEKYDLEIGDYTVSENIVPCWNCRYCKRGDYNMCKFQLHFHREHILLLNVGIPHDVYGFHQTSFGKLMLTN